METTSRSPLMFRTSQVAPINVRPHFFAPDGALALALNVDRKRFATRLAVCNVRKVLTRGFARLGEFLSFLHAQLEVIGFEVHAQYYTPSGVISKHWLVNSPNASSVFQCAR